MPVPPTVVASPPVRRPAAETTPIEPAPLGEGPGASPTLEGSEGLGWWLGAAATLAALVAIAATALLLVRRRAQRPALFAPEVAASAPPEPPLQPKAAPVPRPAPAPRPTPAVAADGARLSLEFRPTRAGLNLLSATVMGEVTVRNTGTASAERVQVEGSLIGAHAEQDAELRTIYTGQLGRLATPPFTLAAGEERRVTVVAVLPLDAIRPVQAAGRPMFVPVVAITGAFIDQGRPRRAGRAFAVGIERVDSAKLAPIWLDGPPRMHDQVAARPHGDLFEA
ncbi:hypothetical protein FHS94_003042 [Sphingomonas aerophila]|uniref:Uncharacterized protein n=1 Tax=Sphingomonas aerophila TaxID=1344948 RepID=A0A7W9EWX3_9SPHN|nr:hypothetical protein [Sphingomonas aerophila]